MTFTFCRKNNRGKPIKKRTANIEVGVRLQCFQSAAIKK